MSSSETGKLTLISSTPGVQFTVLDSGLRPVTSTSNWYQENLASGVYMLEGQIGATTTRRLITVRPGSNETHDLRVDIGAAAPVLGLRTTNETHGDLAHSLSVELTEGVGPDAGIVLILRNLRGPELSPLRTDLLELLDHRFNTVSEMNSDWTRDRSDQAAGRVGRLTPGPYILRTTRYSPAGSPERIDQTIWLSSGWQTLVFIPNTPSGPDPRGLSVQMTDLYHAWRPNDREGAATEAALAGLRDGTASIDRSTIDLLLQGKFENPMLGILGLHTLMLGPSPEPELVRTVIDNLKNLVGDHPDVLAITATLPELAKNSIHVSWPPMLERSYRACLLPAEQARPGVLPIHSPAQQIAPLIRIPGPWLCWTAAEDLGRSAAGLALSPFRDGDEPPFFSGLKQYQFASWEAAALDSVQRAVLEIASFREDPPRRAVHTIGIAELARRTGLPEPLVADSIQTLWPDEPTPPPPPDFNGPHSDESPG